MPWGPHPHYAHLDPFIHGATSSKYYFKLPFVPMVLQALIKERCIIAYLLKRRTLILFNLFFILLFVCLKENEENEENDCTN